MELCFWEDYVAGYAIGKKIVLGMLVEANIISEDKALKNYLKPLHMNPKRAGASPPMHTVLWDLSVILMLWERRRSLVI